MLPSLKKDGLEEETLEEIQQFLDQTICMMKMDYFMSLGWIYGEA